MTQKQILNFLLFTSLYIFIFFTFNFHIYFDHSWEKYNDLNDAVRHYTSKKER